MPWPPQPSDKDDDGDGGLDLALGEDGQIDTGVTSGADPSEWDPIAVDLKGRVDTCYETPPGQSPTTQPGAAVCIPTKR